VETGAPDQGATIPDMSAEEEKEKDEKGKHQNDFINQRLTWLGTFSSLLVVAIRC
jgi:hypothetical protein